MRSIMIILLAGTVISATAMTSVAAISGDDKTKIANGAEDVKSDTTQHAIDKLTEKSSESQAVSYSGEENDQSAHESVEVDSKIQAFFAAADTDVDGVLTQTEYLDYQAAEAFNRFALMAGDDSLVTMEEVKAFYVASKQPSDVPVNDGGASE